MDQQRILYVTYLEKEGPYIKVWGQTVRNVPIAIEEALQQATAKFEQGVSMPVPTDIQVGLPCCAKFKDNRYYRAKVTSTSHLEQGLVEVLFLDYGNKDIIPYNNIRTPIDAASLLSIPPQAKDFLLAEVAMPVWDIDTFEVIGSKLRYLELEVMPICEIGPFIIIRLLKNKQDVCLELINLGLVVKVPIQTQQHDLQQHLQTPGGIHPQYIHQQPPPVMVPIKMASPSPPMSTSTPTLLSYKAMPLEHGSEHDVYVSYVSDGPCMFSVQHQKLETLLKRLMAEINSIDLQPLEEYVLPGTVCLAQSTDDEYICRAVVTNMVDEEYKVFYVDFGNTEVLPFNKLFQIPVKYVIPKVMATRFALSGLETANVSIEMKCAFKDFVNNKLLRMRVQPPAAKSGLPLCDLWDENGLKAIDVIRNSALHSYPEPISLPRGFSQDVKVSFVMSCNKFYVQLKSKEIELQNLMSTLSETCNDRPLLDEENIRQGVPCYALYTDEVWYRAQVVSVGKEIRVKYVDYGNEEVVAINDLREPISEHIFMLKPQAIECCLNGYQNIEPDATRDGLLVDLITEQEFNMKVVEMQANRALVELFDSGHYNVSSLLLEKVASATSQVSPLLIQDNHRFEHRKRSPPQHYKDKRPLREHNERNESNNWRQQQSLPKNQRDGHESSDSKETFNPRDRREFNASSSGFNKNSFQKGPKRFETQRKRFDNGDQAGAETSDEATNGNRENWGFAKKERRFDNNSQPYSSDRPSFKPRDGGFQRNNDDIKRFTPRNQDSSRNFDHPKRFNPNNDTSARNDDHPRRYNSGNDNSTRNDDHPKRFNSTNDTSPRKDDYPKRYSPRNQDGYPKKFNKFDNNQRNKRNDYRKDQNDLSSSDTSERSFKRSPKSYNDNRNKGRSFKKSSPISSEFSKPIGDISNDNWNTDRVTSPPVVESLILAEPTDSFKPIENLIDQTENVLISWFYNPQYFYIQLEKFMASFRSMMEEIQVRYKKRSTITGVIGQPVIALFPEDKVLYRAQILSFENNLYQVRYIDYGNMGAVTKIYAIETKYMELPAQGICCSLTEISPSGENWLNADSYSSCFDKDLFSCHFKSTFDTNGYYVDLTYENVNITESLIASSLAVRPQNDFNINLLLGQQLMALIKAVTSLDNITIEIEPNLSVNASLHNLSDATEKFEDDLKVWIGNFVFVYVDNVINEKLEVTFYDTTGQKLKIIEPDEGAFESVDILCPLPVYTNKINGMVCYATSESIFLQPTKMQETIQQFTDAIFNHYNELTESEEDFVAEVEGVYAIHSSDSGWYRGKVVKIDQESGEAEVNYLDYGNSETVKVTEMRNLTPDFYQMPMLAVEIKIEGGECEKYIDFEVFVEEIYFENECWVGKIFGEDEIKEINNEEVKNEEKPAIEEIVTQDVVTKDEIPITQEVIQNAEINENQFVGVDVTLSHSDSPSEFYLQLSNDLDSISALQVELQTQVPNLVNLDNPAPGILCAAPFSLDGQWYRAQILDADDDITTVRFVDFGNTDVIDNKATAIKTLPAEMLSMEYHAKLCSLYIKPIGEEWSSSVIEKFDNFLGEKSLRAEIIHQDEKTTYVELYANHENVAEYLRKENLASNLELETETSTTGYISHLNSPSEFWMQLDSSVPDLEWVADQLMNASTFPILQDLTPGSLCAAMFPEDKSWYRARILSNTVAGIEVNFIDYGNSYSCTELRELPEELVMLSPLALKCSLSKPAGILQWSTQATEKFNEISADGATVYNVNILTTGETSIIQLMVENEDVSYLLLPELKDCRISCFNSLDDFWVQFIENDPKLKQIETNLNNTQLTDLETPEENEIIVTTYENNLKRAKILNKVNDEFKVLLIDSGIEIVTNNLKKLPEDNETTQEALAKQYKLEVLPRTKWADNSESKFREFLTTTVFQLEEVADGLARLYLNDEDVRISLGSVKCSTPLNSNQNSPKKSVASEENCDDDLNVENNKVDEIIKIKLEQENNQVNLNEIIEVKLEQENNRVDLNEIIEVKLEQENNRVDLNEIIEVKLEQENNQVDLNENDSSDTSKDSIENSSMNKDQEKSLSDKETSKIEITQIVKEKIIDDQETDKKMKQESTKETVEEMLKDVIEVVTSDKTIHSGTESTDEDKK
nr:maternal protein tudor-like isoform X2 [Onthophagus taurus]